MTADALERGGAGPTALIADRYHLRARLGRGAQGEVWEADDALRREVVALKLLDPDRVDPARVRREIAALRLLRLPGVVRLLDEGVAEGRPFFVMERVQGAPFPGAAPPRAWPSIAETTSSPPTSSSTARGGPPCSISASPRARRSTAG